MGRLAAGYRTPLGLALAALCLHFWEGHRVARFADHPPSVQRTTGPITLAARSGRYGDLYAVGIGLQRVVLSCRGPGLTGYAGCRLPDLPVGAHGQVLWIPTPAGVVDDVVSAPIRIVADGKVVYQTDVAAIVDRLRTDIDLQAALDAVILLTITGLRFLQRRFIRRQLRDRQARIDLVRSRHR
jgi:hypothetical protein